VVLIAVIDRFDRHHRQVVELNERTADAAFVSHEGVLAEFLTYFSGSGRIQRRTAAQRVRGLHFRQEGFTVVNE
jgi:hypothetical protein